MLHARGLQQPVDLRRTDLEQLFLKSLREPRRAPLVTFKPFGQRRFEQLAAELITGQPDHLQHRQNLGGFVNDFRSRPPGRRARQWTVQKPQRGFAMITASGAKLVEDALFVRTTSTLITAVNAGQGLAFGRQTHLRGFGNHEYESTYRQTPRLSPAPGNI